MPQFPATSASQLKREISGGVWNAFSFNCQNQPVNYSNRIIMSERSFFPGARSLISFRQRKHPTMTKAFPIGQFHGIQLIRVKRTQGISPYSARSGSLVFFSWASLAAENKPPAPASAGGPSGDGLAAGRGRFTRNWVGSLDGYVNAQIAVRLARLRRPRVAGGQTERGSTRLCGVRLFRWRRSGASLDGQRTGHDRVDAGDEIHGPSSARVSQRKTGIGAHHLLRHGHDVSFGVELER